MTIQQIEIQCRVKAEELIDNNFSNLFREAAIEEPETIGAYSLNLPKQIEAEYYTYLKNLWTEIAPQNSPSFEKIIDKRHLSDKMTDDDREMIQSAYDDAIRRTIWERITKTNHEDVSYYKGLLKRYTEDLLKALRCDFMEDVRRTMENSNQTNHEKEDKNKQDLDEKEKPQEEIEIIRKQIIDLSKKFNVLKECDENLKKLSDQIDDKKENNEIIKYWQDKKLVKETWKKGRSIFIIFALFALLFFVMAAVRSCDPHISLPFIIGSVSSLLIMAIVVVVFVCQTGSVHKHKNKS